VTRPLAFWLATGLLVAIVAAAAVRERQPTVQPLDAAAILELSRRLDFVVSGVKVPPLAPASSPSLPPTRGLGGP